MTIGRRLNRFRVRSADLVQRKEKGCQSNIQWKGQDFKTQSASDGEGTGDTH